MQNLQSFLNQVDISGVINVNNTQTTLLNNEAQAITDLNTLLNTEITTRSSIDGTTDTRLMSFLK